VGHQYFSTGLGGAECRSGHSGIRFQRETQAVGPLTVTEVFPGLILMSLCTQYDNFTVYLLVFPPHTGSPRSV